MAFAHKIRVGVLRGGPSHEYEVSLGTGKAILGNMPEGYEPVDIFISKEGIWHVGGFEKSPYQALRTVDVAVNAMHGAYGEDGTVQKILETFGTPYTGSDSISSVFGMNKAMAKKHFLQNSLKTPAHITVEKSSAQTLDGIARLINENLPFPVIIKPVNSGSSLGISYAENYYGVKEALRKSFEHSPRLIIEEFIKGKEATCGVIEGFRGREHYHLLPAEIKTSQGPFFSYDSKYQNLEQRYYIPGSFSEDEKRQVQQAAEQAHRALGLRHYSRSDFILHPRRGLFVLEVNTLPELTHRSSFVKSLEAVGGSIKEFLSHLLLRTLRG